MNQIFSIEIQDFNLKNTFENGQCFRWNAAEDGYMGVIFGQTVKVTQDGSFFIFYGIDEAFFRNHLVTYFDLKRDYRAIFASIPPEENLQLAFAYGCGLRILRQDPWETLISFIISQNNNIARIKKIIENLCTACGQPLDFCGQTYYTFPDAEQLASLTPDQLRALGCGYRADYIYDTARRIAQGKADLLQITKMTFHDAKNALLLFHGVGPKVADCILLFGMGFYEAFPIDTWIRKVMQKLYLCKAAGEAEMQTCARETFGSYAGIIQQYLFYYARDHKLKGIEIDSKPWLG